jgi:hypothetical protein
LRELAIRWAEQKRDAMVVVIALLLFMLRKSGSSRAEASWPAARATSRLHLEGPLAA